MSALLTGHTYIWWVVVCLSGLIVGYPILLLIGGVATVLIALWDKK